MKSLRDIKAELESIKIVLAGINNSVEEMDNKEEQYKENC